MIRKKALTSSTAAMVGGGLGATTGALVGWLGVKHLLGIENVKARGIGAGVLGLAGGAAGATVGAELGRESKELTPEEAAAMKDRVAKIEGQMGLVGNLAVGGGAGAGAGLGAALGLRSIAPAVGKGIHGSWLGGGAIEKGIKSLGKSNPVNAATWGLGIGTALGMGGGAYRSWSANREHEQLLESLRKYEE